MKTSRVLKIAKGYLSQLHSDNNTKERYICWAITAARDTGEIPHGSARRVQDVIAQRLYPYASLPGWLQSKHGIDADTHCNGDVDKYRDKLQVTRHAWIDSMIAEFQSQGD